MKTSKIYLVANVEPPTTLRAKSHFLMYVRYTHADHPHTLLEYIIAELSSGLKGRRAEPHNYRAKIEIEKTMRLSFHGHRG